MTFEIKRPSERSAQLHLNFKGFLSEWNYPIIRKNTFELV